MLTIKSPRITPSSQAFQPTNAMAPITSIISFSVVMFSVSGLAYDFRYRYCKSWRYAPIKTFLHFEFSNVPSMLFQMSLPTIATGRLRHSKPGLSMSSLRTTILRRLYLAVAVSSDYTKCIIESKRLSIHATLPHRAANIFDSRLILHFPSTPLDVSPQCETRLQNNANLIW